LKSLPTMVTLARLGVARRVPADAGTWTRANRDFRPCLLCRAAVRVERMTPGVLSLEQLSHTDCVQLLIRAQVGRVVFTVAALPAVVPVTFAVLDDAVVMCTASDTRLAAAADGGVLAFEIDDLDPPSRTGWSVVVTGVAELVTDALTRARIHGMVAPWAPGHHDVFIRLPLTVVTGRRIVAATPVPSAHERGPNDVAD